MNWWRRIKRSLGQDHQDLPKVTLGSRWTLDAERDPFRGKVIATVDEIREDWVKYHFEGGSIDWTLPIKRFVSLYLPLEKSCNKN